VSAALLARLEYADGRGRGGGLEQRFGSGLLQVARGELVIGQRVADVVEIRRVHQGGPRGVEGGPPLRPGLWACRRRGGSEQSKFSNLRGQIVHGISGIFWTFVGAGDCKLRAPMPELGVALRPLPVLKPRRRLPASHPKSRSLFLFQALVQSGSEVGVWSNTAPRQGDNQLPPASGACAWAALAFHHT